MVEAARAATNECGERELQRRVDTQARVSHRSRRSSSCGVLRSLLSSVACGAASLDSRRPSSFRCSVRAIPSRRPRLVLSAAPRSCLLLARTESLYRRPSYVASRRAPPQRRCRRAHGRPSSPGGQRGRAEVATVASAAGARQRQTTIRDGQHQQQRRPQQQRRDTRRQTSRRREERAARSSRGRRSANFLTNDEAYTHHNGLIVFWFMFCICTTTKKVTRYSLACKRSTNRITVSFFRGPQQRNHSSL